MYRNPTSPWGSAPLPIDKPGPDKFWVTVDLHPVNLFTIPHQFPMSSVEQDIQNTAGSRCYETFDISHGYWQLRIEKSTKSTQSFVTPYIIYSPAAFCMVRRMQWWPFNVPCRLKYQRNYCAIYCKLDDVLLGDWTPDQFFTTIRRVFELCKEFNFQLHLAKCII